MPGDLATFQASVDEIDNVGVLAWFEVEEIPSLDRIDINCLDAERGHFRITKEQFDQIKQVMSNFDIVHTHHPHSGFYAKLIAKYLGKSVFVTEHNSHTGLTRKGHIANGLTNPLATQIVCVSESVWKSFGQWERIMLGEDKIIVINNGVNIDRLTKAKDINWSLFKDYDISDDAIIVGSAGMLTEQKAHDVLIEAVDLANKRIDRPIELVISGDGRLRSRLEALIDSATYPDRLHLLGFLPTREHVYRMMEQIDIYAMPSRWEGFCVAALEAMALANPCVFSDIDSFYEPFREVALFHELDDSDQLAQHILEFANNRDKRESYAKSARELVVETYTLDNTAQEYVSLYKQIYD